MIYFMSAFSFDMYTLMCLYFYTAISTAIAAQTFWNNYEFCQHFNYHVNQSSADVISKTNNITCIEFNNSQSNIGKLDKLFNVRLFCREFDSLTYTWDNTTNVSHNTIVVVEFISYQTTEIHKIHETNLSFIRFDDLNPNTKYMARFRTLMNGIVNHNTADTPGEMTLHKNRKSDPVNSIRVFDFKKMDKNKLESSLTWLPSKDMNCQYQIIYHSVNKGEQTEIPKIINLDVEGGPYVSKLRNLRTGAKYSVLIQSSYYYSLTPDLIKGETAEFQFNTSSCMFINNNNQIMCPPGQPYNLSLTEKALGGGRYDARLSWCSPSAAVDYYVVKLDKWVRTVSGPVNDALFGDVLLDDEYSASVQAFSTAGSSAETVVHRESRSVEEQLVRHRQRAADAEAAGRLFRYGFASLTALALCCCAAAGLTYRWRRRQQPRVHDDDVDNEYVDNVNNGEDYACKTATTQDPMVDGGYGCGDLETAAVLKGLGEANMLLDRGSVFVSDVCLGRGHFGVVRKGALRAAGAVADRPVAVKSLRDRPTGRDLEEFLGEILLMQKVGKHTNIVSMIGCCLNAHGQCMLVVEYCSLGDLQTYLRKVNVKSWYANEFTNNGLMEFAFTKEIESHDTGNPMLPIVFNNCYLYHGEENIFLTVDDLLRFASQVANGMMFLEKNRIVHRDLAARNVLLSDHHTIKICDFGLSRDVYEQNLYQKLNRGDPLPVKWMALESLKYCVYTTQSDVWSYGVLLWEIMTLGSSPYSTISSSRICEVLHNGYRMPKPTLCCYSLYEIMLGCWNSNPADRPKFGSIKDMIDSMMDNQYS